MDEASEPPTASFRQDACLRLGFQPRPVKAALHCWKPARRTCGHGNGRRREPRFFSSGHLQIFSRLCETLASGPAEKNGAQECPASSKHFPPPPKVVAPTSRSTLPRRLQEKGSSSFPGQECVRSVPQKKGGTFSLSSLCPCGVTLKLCSFRNMQTC